MKLYITRHGESLGNQQKSYQNADTPLSDIGPSQAKMLAHRFKNIQIDTILASPFKRAVQTAKQVATVSNKKIETNSLFREYEWPPELFGLNFDDPQAKEVRQKIANNIDKPNWRYSTEETFYEMQSRADRARQFLEKRFIENQQEPNILLVSHAFFLTVMIGEIIFKEVVQQPSKFINYFRSIKYSNTGISVLTFNQEKPELEQDIKTNNGWRLLTFNDHAHLG